jgi:hypothetical protein
MGQPLEVQLLFRPLIKDLFFAGVAQLVERDLAKVDVAGSNPVSRFRFFYEVKKSFRSVLAFTQVVEIVFIYNTY